MRRLFAARTLARVASLAPAPPAPTLESVDPRAILARQPMHARQIAAVATCVLLLALDGYDVLSISFASPGIAKDWGIDRAVLGIVLSMELIGMALGSIILGAVADRVGRRPTTLACLGVMAAGMACATLVHDVPTLSLVRVVTGFGIGGMLASANAATAEHTNARRRDLAVALVAVGYPVGAIVGGTLASTMLATGGWRSVFTIGAVASAACIPLAWLFLPETVPFLVTRRPTRALERIDTAMRRLGHGAVSALPELDRLAPRASVATLFSPALARTTALLTIAYFTHVTTFYFLLKWIPKIVVDMGHTPSAAGRVLVWANVGGATGGLIYSLLVRRYSARVLLLGTLLLSVPMVIAFGRGQASLAELSFIVAVTGACTNGGMVGLFTVVVRAFPSAVRSGGTGFVIGVGRGGSALSPILAGFLFASGAGLQRVAIVMAMGSLLAAMAVLLVRDDVAT